MEKIRKIIILTLVLAIVGTIFIPSIESRTITKDITSADEKIQCQDYTIDYFEYCIISGTYDLKISDETYEVIVESNTKSITVTGWAVVLDLGDIPQSRYCSVRTNAIRAEAFIGKCTDGEITGTGLHEVRIGNYESKQKNEAITRSVLDSLESETLGNPIEVFTFIQGKYTSIDKIDNWLTITCQPGDIVLKGIRVEDSTLEMFTFFRNNQATSIKIQDYPRFRGYYKNGHIHGIALGDIIYNENNEITSKSNENLPEHTIEYFQFCHICGKYSTQTSDEQYSVIVNSDTESIKVRGLAWVVDVGEIPEIRFCTAKTDTIKAEKFIGKCSNGLIRGIGLNRVEI